VEKDDLTAILNRMRGGDETATEELFQSLHSQMRVAAQALMFHERADHTLQPSALVNEAVVKLLSSNVFKNAEDRLYLFAAANRAMRQVLVDHARKRKADKRPDSHRKSALDSVLNTLKTRDQTDILELTEAIDVLRHESPRQIQIMELSFFSGLQHLEIGELLNISIATVKRDLTLAKAKLAEMLKPI
jgi:RNA polymerase sigma factor (TIGR02999 family)